MIIKTPWVSQPQVATSVNSELNPAAAWNFATKRDAVTGLGMVFGADNSSGVWQDGRYIKVTGSTSLNRVECVSSVSAISPAAGDFTVTVTFVFDGITGGYSALGRWNTGGTPSTSDWFLGAGSTFGVATADFTVACGSSVYSASAAGAWVVGNKYTFIGRRRGTTIFVNRYNHTTGVWVSGSTTNAGITTINYNAARKTKLGEIDLAAGYNIAATYSTAATFKRCLTDSEIKSLSDNPWQIFKPIPRRIFVPVSAGSDVTITATLGNADATGYTATISAASPVTINAALGTATASGLSATLAQAFSLSANIGTATASGKTATIAQAATISASLATATASGYTASVSSAGNVTISCNLGTATAAGNQATIGANVTVSASLGAASAAGYTAALDIAYTLAANLGTASATGNTATIFANETIACAIGAALATGYSATVSSTAQLTDSEKIDLILDILSNKQTLDPVSHTYTLYADDGVTVLKTALAWEDSEGTIPYRGQALQRLDEMQ